jgi:DEAD/DEAH box helicase
LPESFELTWEIATDDLKTFFSQNVKRTELPASQIPSVLGLSELGNVEQVLAHYWEARQFTPRAGQAKMTKYVWDALIENRFKLIEAPTGTGKTIACLVPALVKALSTGERVALSTAYRNLQDQLLAEIETVNKLLGIPFRYQVMKGIANYPCYNRLLDYISEFKEDTPANERFVASYLLSRALVGPQGTLDDLNYWVQATFEVADSVYTAISAGKGGCTFQHHEDFAVLLPEQRLAQNPRISYLLTTICG